MSSTDGSGRSPSLYGAMLRTEGAPGRWRRARWLASLVVMWGFLAFPVGDVVRARTALPGAPARWAVLSALGIFALMWLRALWLALATTAPAARIGASAPAGASAPRPRARSVGSLG